MITKLEHSCLATVSALVLAIGSTAANAQAVEKTDDAANREEIVVTGSRIARPEIEFSNPVTSVSAELIQRSGKTDITTLLVDSPQLVGSLVNGANAGSNSQNYSSPTSSGANNVGTSVLDLRHLGTQRTLVLVDGRRHVNAYSGENSVDINTIPVDLI